MFEAKPTWNDIVHKPEWELLTKRNRSKNTMTDNKGHIVIDLNVDRK